MSFPDVIVNFLAAFVATVGFSTIFNIPRRELVYSGLTGGLGWLLFEALISINAGILVTATFFGAVLITCVSRVLSFARRVPITIYLVGGIIPLVPGTGIYYTMYNLVTGANADALEKGIETLKVAGVIAIGIIIVLSLPWKMFSRVANPLEKLFGKLEKRKKIHAECAPPVKRTAK